MNAKVTVAVLVLAGVTLVWADKRPTFGYEGPEESDQGYDSDSNGSSDEAKYDFSWSVEDDSGSYENRYGHQESRDGDYTEGSYYVLLPDGRTMTVTYYVDGYSGFVPEVTFDGSAEYDSGESSHEKSEENDSRRQYD